MIYPDEEVSRFVRGNCVKKYFSLSKLSEKSFSYPERFERMVRRDRAVIKLKEGIPLEEKMNETKSEILVLLLTTFPQF